MVNKLSKTFCVHPWTNLMVNSPGTYNFCCISLGSDTSISANVTDDDGKLVHASKDTPDKA